MGKVVFFMRRIYALAENDFFCDLKRMRFATEYPDSRPIHERYSNFEFGEICTKVSADDC